MRIGNFEHKPSLTIILLYLAFTAALLSLGTWQMQRAATKTTILAAAALSQDAEAVTPADIIDVELAAKTHKRVALTGRYLGEQQFLWDNRVHKGQAGFEVITPVRTSDGIVLVNRGWIAPGATRQDLPDVALSGDVADTPVAITGLFSRPSKGFASGAAFDMTEPWPRMLQYFDYQAMEQALNAGPLLAGVIQPQLKRLTGDEVVFANSDQRSTRENRADYYTANWEPAAAIGPARHYGYAFQWYAMAAALTILYIVYNTRRIEPV